MSTFNSTLELPTRILFRNVGGEPVYLDLDGLPANVLADILVGGVKIISTNAWNGSGKDAAEGERLAAVQKRWDSWKRGEYAITERAASQTALMREAYVAEMLAKHPQATAKAIEDKIKATVKEVLGKDVNATFDNFLSAIATTLGKAKGAEPADKIKAKLVAKYETAAAAIEASRNAAAKVELDLTAIEF